MKEDLICDIRRAQDERHALLAQCKVSPQELEILKSSFSNLAVKSKSVEVTVCRAQIPRDDEVL